NWSKRLYSISIGLALIMEVPMTLKVLILHEFDILFSIIWLFLVLISYFGLTLMIYVMLMSYLLVYRNTRIYDIILSTIIDRVKGYTDEHESILTKKNYEVVGVLSDTPGLSIRSLGDIPVGGLSAAIFVVNAAIFLLFSPFLIEGPVADFFLKLIQNFQRMADSDPTGLSLVIVLGIFLSSLAAFGAVLMPLIRITRVMSAFKVKALIELDPFLFEEITSVALKRDTIITNETQVLFMLRSYIHTMKVSPVHPIRVVQLVLLAILYAYRAVPVIIGLISG
ncbi:MAG: hypothetical protein OEY49_19235, partial [Candidatus Heimdallarchaeota archaeon]|nr:hypothetical protein [Candidatus Heimdallarchaeota archaeon]